MNELIFRKINGHIVPIKKNLEVKKGDVSDIGKVVAGSAIAVGSGIASAKMIRKATFSFGKSANLRGISQIAFKGSPLKSSLIKQAAQHKIAGKVMANRGFGLLLAGITAGGLIATYGANNILNKRKVSTEKKLAIASGAGAIVSGAGLATFGKLSKIQSLSKLIKVANPKEAVSKAFSIYSKEGAARTLNTINKYKKTIYDPNRVPKYAQPDMFGNYKRNIFGKIV